MKTGTLVAACAAALAIAVAAPFFMSSFVTGLFTTSLIFAIFAVSLNIILGHGGLASLGHAMFFGTGGYAVALLVQHGFDNPLLCIFAGVAASIVAAALIGPIVLRTREFYFLMVTLAIAEILRNLAISWRSLTSGDDGISGLNPGVFAGVDFSDGRNFYFLSLGSLVVTLLFVAMITNAPFGHVLRALRDNRSRMSVLGVRPISVQLSAFMIAAGIAGFAGGLFAYQKEFVSPTIFSVESSAQALLMVMMGGTGTLFGPVIGAFLVEGIRGIASIYTDRWQSLLGLLTVIVALTSPRVLRGGLFSHAWQILAGRDRQAGAFGTQSTQRSTNAIKPHVQLAAVQPRLPPASAVTQNPILRVDNLVKRYGGLSVLTGISLSINAGERRGLIGPNGAGKTTLLNMLSGIVAPTSGSIHYAAENITTLPVYARAMRGIGRTFQIGNLFNECTVRRNLELALIARNRYGLRFAQPLVHYSALREEAQTLLDTWQLRDVADVLVGTLSYGQRRIIEIVVALAAKPKLLLLDEPAAGLSGTETKAIIETVSSLDPEITILVIEHDMDLIFSLCDRVTVLANGKVLADGPGDEVRRDPAVIDAYLGMPL